MHDLFQHIPQDEELYRNAGMVKVHNIINGLGFFPVGSGFYYNKLEDISHDKRIMILGQDFSNVKYYEEGVLKSDGESETANPTWRNLIKLLKSADIDPQNCFYTNSFMGLRVGESSSGVSPCWESEEILETSRALFIKQIDFFRPKLVIALGIKVVHFLEPFVVEWKGKRSLKGIDNKQIAIAKGITIGNITTNFTVITHPSFAHINQQKRFYAAECGLDAEISIIKNASN